MTSLAPASAPNIVCFGETLFDLLPAGRQIGGAPLNVAYHFRQLGGGSAIVSRVGRDELGGELLRFTRENDLDRVALQLDDALATGTVSVTFRNPTSPVYEIVSPVAWDRIAANDEALRAVSASDALVFGSLAARSTQNLKSLSLLLPAAKMRVLDVNLRAPYYGEAGIKKLLGYANVVKVNDEEIRLLGEWYGWSGTDEEILGRLFDELGLRAAVLTRGKDGAVLVDKTGRYEHPGFRVSVADTVGAGDSFLAAFLFRYLSGTPPNECLLYAGAVGALIASKTGGTPDYDGAAVRALIDGDQADL